MLAFVTLYLMQLSSVHQQPTAFFVPYPENRWHYVVNGSIREVRIDSDGEIQLTGNDPGAFYSGPNKLLVRPNEEVYELRNGMVILGKINSKWKFVPKQGSIVITFEQYLKDYQAFRTPRIYNLPGTIEWRKGASVR